MTTRMRRLGRATVGLALTGVLCVAGASAAFAHGYIGGGDSTMTARAALTANTDLGPVQYEPQSLEAPKGFPEAGPPDGQIASAGGKFGGNLDEQTATRWVKNDITPGPNKIHWTLTANHATQDWKYFITKNGWDPNAPLSRAEFQPLLTVPWDGSPASGNTEQTLPIPSDHTGYHVILAVWEIADTPNAFYNVIDVNIQGQPTPDTQAPTAPTAVASTYVTSSEIDLGWTAATDNVAVKEYQVYRNGTLLGTTTTTKYTDTGLQPGTAYTYTIKAVDTSDNVSPASTPATITTENGTGPDTQAPTAPSGVHSMATTATSVDLMWTASKDNVGVSGYTITRTTDGGATATFTSSGTEYVDNAVTPDTTYHYTVTASDAAGNISPASESFTVTTLPDGQYPTWNPFGTYQQGDKVVYEGQVYQCVTGYTGMGDPNWIHALSLWQIAV